MFIVLRYHPLAAFFRFEGSVPIWTDPDRTSSDLVKKLHAWWMAKRRSCGIPDRKDFDPVQHKPLLCTLMISEAEHDPFRIRYRLVGTRVVTITGFDFTGRYLDELLGTDTSEPWMDYYRSSYRTRAPLLGRATAPNNLGTTFSYEFCIVPVTLEGDAVKQFIAVEDYFGLNLASANLRSWPPQS